MTTTTESLIDHKSAQISSDITTWADLVKALDGHEGVAMIPMETLRKLEGAQRLGVHVLKSISTRLSSLGLGHMPAELPNRQDQEAILYRYGTPASQVIHAVRDGLRSVQDMRNTYESLYKLNALPDMTQVVHRDDMNDKLKTAAQAVLELLGPNGRAVLDNG